MTVNKHTTHSMDGSYRVKDVQGKWYHTV